MPTASPDVLIIGGGLSGLSTAVELSKRQYSVLLLEQKQHLGGRTYSFIHPETGDEVDNGQHLMMGCYHATLKYLSTIQRHDRVEIQKNLSILFRHPKLPPSTLQCASLPAPLNIGYGIMGLKNLTIKQRVSLLRVGVELMIRNPDTNTRLREQTVTQWLDALHQPSVNKKYLWDIIAIGALNDSTDKISAALFAKVLKSVFFGSRKNSSMVIPKRGLTNVLVEGAEEFLLKNNGSVLTGTTVEKIEKSEERIVSITIDKGIKFTPRAVVSAVPYFDIPKIFHDPASIGLSGLDRFISSPIITIHLWFDAHFVPEQFAAMIDSPIHWVFNKSRIFGREEHGLMYLALVVSGAHNLVTLEKEGLQQLAHDELKRYYPAASISRVVHSLIIKEKRATFSPTVGMEQFRPSHTTALKNLFLAGDWTDTKLPATIEGAVKSGADCAEHVAHFLKAT